MRPETMMGGDALRQPEHELARLRTAASAGDSRAKGQLAERLLTRQPYSLEEGAHWAVAGARDGDAEAAHLAALLSAWGLGLKQDWPQALDFLLIAAQAGHARDARVLAGLAGEWACAPGPATDAANCARLRQQIRIEELLKLPPLRIVSTAPRIAILEQFLAREMCQWLVGRARPNLRRAQVYDPSTGAEASATRTNTECHIPTFESDLVVMLLQHRIAALTGVSLAGMEACTVLHYAPGEEFRRHHDCFDTSSPENARIVAREGQRVMTFLVWLNEEYSGGETEFPHLNLRCRGRTGDALMFWNITPDFSPDLRTLHAGLPPKNGEKWLFSQWTRGRRP